MHELTFSRFGCFDQMSQHPVAVAPVAVFFSDSDLGQIAVFKHIPQITIGNDLAAFAVDKKLAQFIVAEFVFKILSVPRS